MKDRALAGIKQLSQVLYNRLTSLSPTQSRVVVFTGAFSVIGVVLLLSSSAAVPTASLEPEIAASGLSCPTQLSDATASNGKAVRFGGCTTSSRSWRTSGLVGGGYVNSMSYSPTDDASKLDSLHVVTVTDVSGIFYSENGGTSWRPANGAATGGGDLRVSSVVWHPTTPGLVFTFYGNCTAGSGGVMKSTDYGKSWSKVSTAPTACGNGLGSGNSYGLPSRQPRIVGKLLGIDKNNGYIYAGTFNQGIMRASLSNLSSWQTIALGPNTQGVGSFYIRALTVDEQDPTVVYAATYDGTTSTDGDGRVWRIKNANGTPTIEKLSNSPIDSEDVFSLAGNLYTTNTGDGIEGGVSVLGNARGAATNASFKRIAGPAYSLDSCGVAGAYSGSCAIWFSVTGYVSNGQTTLWVGVSNAPSIGGVFKPFWKGVSSTGFLSDDGAWSSYPVSKASVKNDILGPLGAWWILANGNPWSIPGTGDGYDIGDIAVGKSDAHPVFIAGQTAMWRSTDQGATWDPSLDGFLNLVNRDVIADPNNPAKVYQTNVDYKVFESNDHLTNAAPIPKVSGMTSDGWSIALDASTNPTTVYLGLGDRDTNTGGQIWRRDAAGTWTQIDSGAFGGLRPIGIGHMRDASNNLVLLAAIQDGGVWKKVGSGAWTKLSIPAADAGKDILMNQGSLRSEIRATGSTFYVYDRDTGLWRGDNYGTTWTRIYKSPSDAEAVGFMQVHPTDPKIVFVSDSTGVYRITNANTAAKDGAAATKISGTITDTGAMTLGPNNQIYFVTRPTSSARPRIYQGNYTQSTVTWTDLSDDYFRSFAVKIVTIAASSDGTLYASSGNNSTIVLDP